MESLLRRTLPSKHKLSPFSKKTDTFALRTLQPSGTRDGDGGVCVDLKDQMEDGEERTCTSP